MKRSRINDESTWEKWKRRGNEEDVEEEEEEEKKYRTEREK